jgi:hypothetical protein
MFQHSAITLSWAETVCFLSLTSCIFFWHLSIKAKEVSFLVLFLLLQFLLLLLAISKSLSSTPSLLNVSIGFAAPF